MNSTTAGPASGAFLSLGVTPPTGARKSVAADPAGQGDFQRLLRQAAEKKSAAQQQQARQLESRQAEQRLQENKQQENKLQEQRRQAKATESRDDKVSPPDKPVQNQTGEVPQSSAAQPDGRSDLRNETAGAEPSTADASLQPSDRDDQPEPVSADVHPAPSPPPVPEEAVDSQRLPAGGSELSPANPMSISLAEIARAVAEMSGAATLGATGTAVPGGPRSSTGAYYNNSTHLASGYTQALSDHAESLTTKDTAVAPELNMAVVARQLMGAGANNPSAAPLMAGSHWADEAGAGSVDDATLSSSLTPGQAVEGKSTPLAPAAAPLNTSTALRAGLGQPEWHNAIAERVAVMASKNLTSAEIQLDPPELGQLLVRVTLNQEHASVNFSSQHAAVREALDQTAHRLREMFDAEGLNLVNVDVSDRSFRQRQEQETAAGPGGDAAADAEPAAEPVLLRQGQGLIDQFV